MNQPTISATPTATVPTVARTGAIAHMVRIRALPGSGTPSITLTGLPDDSAWRTRDRLHAAIANSGLAWPDEAIAVSVFPHDLPAADADMDAALAVAVLAATGHLPGVALGEVAVLAVLGELGLDGTLRPVSDITARLAVVAGAGIPHAVVPAGNLTDAVRTPGVTVRAARTLRELVDGLRGQLPLLTPAAWPTPPTLPGADLADVSATHPGRRLVKIAAAGGHHLAILGRGIGAVMLAQRLPGLLPDLDEATAAQVAEAYRQAGLLPADAPVLLRPPWQAPHHSVSLPALTGNTRRPGAIALAHGGVLFCDDAAELPAPPSTPCAWSWTSPASS